MEKLKAMLIALLLLSAYTLVSEMDYQDQVRHHQSTPNLLFKRNHYVHQTISNR